MVQLPRGAHVAELPNETGYRPLLRMTYAQSAPTTHCA